MYIPYLPEILLDRVDAPHIFMMGLKRKHYDTVQDNVKDGTYIFDIDRNLVR